MEARSALFHWNRSCRARGHIDARLAVTLPNMSWSGHLRTAVILLSGGWEGPGQWGTGEGQGGLSEEPTGERVSLKQQSNQKEQSHLMTRTVLETSIFHDTPETGHGSRKKKSQAEKRNRSHPHFHLPLQASSRNPPKV